VLNTANGVSRKAGQLCNRKRNNLHDNRTPQAQQICVSDPLTHSFFLDSLISARLLLLLQLVDFTLFCGAVANHYHIRKAAAHPPTSVRLPSKVINNDHRRCATNGNCYSLVCTVWLELVAIWCACCLVSLIGKPHFTNSPLKTMSNVLHWELHWKKIEFKPGHEPHTSQDSERASSLQNPLSSTLPTLICPGLDSLSKPKNVHKKLFTK
jgi:hypothetical protein